MLEFRTIEWISSLVNRKSLCSLLVFDRTRQVLYPRIEVGVADHRLSLGIQPKSVPAKGDFRVLNIIFVI